MKYSQDQLKKIIQEELKYTLKEARPSRLGDVASLLKDLDDKTSELVLLRLATFLGRSDSDLAELFSKALQVTQAQKSRMSQPTPAPTGAPVQEGEPVEESEEVEEGLKDIWAGLKTGAGKVKSDVAKYGKEVGQSVKAGYVGSKVGSVLQKTSKLAGELVGELEKLQASAQGLPMATEFTRMIPILKATKTKADNMLKPQVKAVAATTTPPPPPAAATKKPSKVASTTQQLKKLRRTP